MGRRKSLLLPADMSLPPSPLALDNLHSGLVSPAQPPIGKLSDASETIGLSGLSQQVPGGGSSVDDEGEDSSSSEEGQEWDGTLPLQLRPPSPLPFASVACDGATSVQTDSNCLSRSAGKLNTAPSKRFTRYQIIGRGTHGTVYSVLDTLYANEPVAIKKIRTGTDKATQMRRRAAMWHEIRVMAHLGWSDPWWRERFPRMKRYMRDQGVPLMVMTLHGPSLQDVLDRYFELPVCRDQVRQIGHQLVGALVFLHHHRVYHTDLKPGNVVLDSPGARSMGTFVLLDSPAVRVIDFGCAYLEDDPRAVPTLRHRRGTIGTPAFRPPEVWLGMRWDATCDLFALGATLLNLFTGNHVLEPDVWLAQTEAEFLVRLEAVVGPMPDDLHWRISKLKPHLFHANGTFKAVGVGRHHRQLYNLTSLVRFHPTPKSKSSDWVDMTFVDALRTCMAWDPRDRPSARTAFKYPYFNLTAKAEAPRATSMPH